MTKLSSIFVSVAVAVLLVSCGGSSKSATRTPTGKQPKPWYLQGRLAISPVADTRHVVVEKLPHLGVVLVDGKRYTLYAFVPDQPGTPCAGSCAATWPPFTLTSAHVLDMSPTLDEKRIDVEPKEFYPRGVRLVSYGGWLLHSYVGDTSPGMTAGQGLHSDGGYWYAISPSGKLVTTKP